MAKRPPRSVSPAPSRWIATASGSAPGVASSTRASWPWCPRTTSSGRSATIVSRTRSWIGSATSRPSRSPGRTNLLAASKDTTSSIASVCRSLAQERQRQRPSGDGDDLQEPAGIFRELREPRVDDLLERDAGAVRREEAGRRLAGQLFDQERVAARLAGDRVDHASPRPGPPRRGARARAAGCLRRRAAPP